MADFYCASNKLVVELDGKHHEFGDQLEYDKARDSIINQLGYKIIRIKNEELHHDVEMVMKKIEEAL